MEQPALFEANRETDVETVVLYALGEFQSRGKVLADRELVLDRLRGAFKRAAVKFETAELDDETISAVLAGLGAKVIKVPTFVAKHPYRVTVPNELAIRAREMFTVGGSGFADV